MIRIKWVNKIALEHLIEGWADEDEEDETLYEVGVAWNNSNNLYELTIDQNLISCDKVVCEKILSELDMLKTPDLIIDENFEGPKEGKLYTFYN